MEIDYLITHSNLPGPRANLSLLYEVTKTADDTFIEACLKQVSEYEPNSPSEFVLSCGASAYIFNQLVKKSVTHIDYKWLANHPSWRVREAVCIGVQLAHEFVPADVLSQSIHTLANGSYLEMRAYVATVCEPALLEEYLDVDEVYRALLQITLNFTNLSKLSEEQKVLRKSLGYGWSVILSIHPEQGRQYFNRLLDLANSTHLKWIIKENMKKKRMNKLDPKWLDHINSVVDL